MTPCINLVPHLICVFFPINSVYLISACFVFYSDRKLFKQKMNSYLLDFFLGFYIIINT